MSVRVAGVAAPLAAIVLFASALAIEVRVHAQAAPAPPAAGQGRQGGAAQGGGGRGRGGRGIPAPLPPGRTAAPVDLTGNWVSVVTEDWEWRMMTPKKRDYASVRKDIEFPNAAINPDHVASNLELADGNVIVPLYDADPVPRSILSLFKVTG